MSNLRLRIGTWVYVSLLVVLTASPAFALVVGQDAPGLARAMEAQEQNTPGLMSLGGVVGTAVGLRADGKPVVKIYTEGPGVAGIPKTLNGVPVMVEVTGKIFILPKPPGTPGNGPGNGGDGDDTGGGGGGEPSASCPTDPTQRSDRPVCTGMSTGHTAITAGTIGSRVTDGTNVWALSNNHVYADENNASIGDVVLQPGTFDGGGSPADDLGTLFDFEPIVFSTSANNVIDAAIASLGTADLGNSTPSNGYGTPKSTTLSPVNVGLRVMKYGRTTGLTKGRVDAINATVNVGYGTGVARFVNQIIIRPGGFSAGGDSGSLIVVEKGGDKRKPVGLLFAGSSIITVANPIDDVLTRFGVTIDGQ